jgi:hypothetical protein
MCHCLALQLLLPLVDEPACGCWLATVITQQLPLGGVAGRPAQQQQQQQQQQQAVASGTEHKAAMAVASVTGVNSWACPWVHDAPVHLYSEHWQESAC